jgi:uncharacterized protein YndB with AHSA1/START domain
MELRFERILPCEPEVAFALISDPDRMNLWSRAPVRSLAGGDGGHPGGVGALREVRLPGKRPRVLEEIVEISDPPHRFAYRVIAGLPVTSHYGEIRLVPVAEGTSLEWEVRVRFPFPGMGVVARRKVEPQLARSLDRLVEVARRAGPGPLPLVRSLSEDDALPELYGEAAALIEAQRVLADELRDARDPRAWITRAYQWLSEAAVAGCRAGELQHPAWALRLLPRLHQPYSESLDRWLHRERGAPEDYWRAIFEEVASPSHRALGKREGARRSVGRAIDALIAEDLPLALAAVYVRAYADRCDYARFRADFLRFEAVFRGVDERLDAALRRGALPLGAHAAHVLLPPGVREAIGRRRSSRTARRHRDAFERGARLVRLVREQEARA